MAYHRESPKVAELHVFDFDGTIFYSPSVDDATAAAILADQLQRDQPERAPESIAAEAKSLTGALSNPVSAGGLGWYQSLSSLCPPTVPQHPDVATWYVAPIIKRIRELAARRFEAVLENHFYQQKAILYVLTGRDAKYTQRIRDLLWNANLLDCIDFVFLKPSETAGTVKFKQNKLLELIRRHEPRHVFYYDDRREQGGRIFAGLHELQTLLYAPADARSAWIASDAAAVPLQAHTQVSNAVDGESVTTCAAPCLSPHAFSTLCELTDDLPLTAGSATRAATEPVAAASSVIEFTELFRDRSDPVKEATRAIRTGRRWAVESISFLNSRFGTDGKPSATKSSVEEGTVPPSKRQRPSATDDVLVAEDVHFHVPPPFHLTQVFMPQAITEHSDHMLNKAQTQVLIETLQSEKFVYDEMTPAEREAQQSQQSRGRGRGGGGRGGGRGGQGGSRGRTAHTSADGRRTVGDGVWKKIVTENYDSAFPALPGLNK